jgi:hypothetical protein
MLAFTRIGKKNWFNAGRSVLTPDSGPELLSMIALKHQTSSSSARSRFAMRSVRVALRATATSQKNAPNKNALSDFFRQGVLRGILF